MSNVVVDLEARRAAKWGGEPWMSKRQAAAYLGVTVRCMTNWQRDLGLPFRRVGGINLYRRSELDVWVDDQHKSCCGDRAI